MRIYSILFKAEFKRFWSIGILIFAFALVLISLIPSLVNVKAGMTKSLSSLVDSMDAFISFFAFLVFSAGIVNADVKSGWLRTLLIRSVTREQYIVTKILIVFVSLLIVFLASLCIDVLIISFNKNLVLKYDVTAAAAVFLLKSAHLLLMTVLSALISCGMQGSFNGYFVLAWYTLSQLVGFIVMKNYWDVKWAVVLQEYIFPNGFEDAKSAFLTQQIFPAGELLWGIGALMFFFSLTLFSVNRIVVDTGSE